MSTQSPNNTVASILSFFKNGLHGLYDEREIESFVKLSLEHFSSIPYTTSLTNQALSIDAELLVLYQQTVDKLQQNQPIQYILGQTEFYGLPIKVTPAVLIPRPETEELVDLIVKQYQNQQGVKMLDLCTGSGCIALALNKNLLQSQVYGIDVSTDALAVANENNVLNNASVQFIQADVLSDNTAGYPNNLDVVVSNPPYVPQAELASIATNVKDYEPHLALFVPDNEPLLFYKKISTLAFGQLLTPGGRLYFECHTNYAAQVVTLLQEIGYKNCQLINDIGGHNRMVSAQK